MYGLSQGLGSWGGGGVGPGGRVGVGGGCGEVGGVCMLVVGGGHIRSLIQS